jgi:hypothetical protein
MVNRTLQALASKRGETGEAGQVAVVRLFKGMQDIIYRYISSPFHK